MKNSFARAVALATFGAVLASAAHAASPINLKVGGHLYNAFSVNAVDDNGANTDYDATTISQDAYVSLAGDTVLDNGIKVGANVAFSFLAAGQNNIYKEDIFAYVGGHFGEFHIGRKRDVGALMHNYIPSAGLPGIAVDDGRIVPTVNGVVTTTATTMELSGGEYENQVQYFTPRIAGFQLGLSYAQDGDSGDDFSAGVSPQGSATALGATESILTGAANYENSFGGFDFGLSGAYGYAFQKVRNTPRDVNFQAWQSGAYIGYMDFKLGGAIGQLMHDGIVAGQDDQADTRYGAGLSWANGPWTAGLSWLHQDADTGYLSPAAINTGGAFGVNSFAAGGNVDQQDVYELGGTYTMGPGVVVGLGAHYNDQGDFSGTTTSAEDSITGTAVLGLSF